MNADAQAIIEQSLRYILEDQQKLLKRSDADKMIPVILALNDLAIDTQTTIASGISRLRNVDALLKKARKIEEISDDISEELWSPIVVSVSPMYERLTKALNPSSDWIGAAAELRSYYQSLRIRLLEQALGARTLDNNADLGIEMEHIWQQWLQRMLGNGVKVLTGGVITNYEGHHSPQIDLIVVPSEAHVIFPSDSSDGKAHVAIDQVISAIMIKSTLSAQGFRDDLEKLQRIPNHPQMVQDHPVLAPRENSKPHAWPFTFIIGCQSSPIEELKTAWEKAVVETSGPFPQLVLTLDSGFLYSGGSCWPRPAFPGNYTEADQVMTQEGKYSGLGLGWLIVQHQARLAVINRRALEPIARQKKALDNAMMTSATPINFSQKFDSMFRTDRPIAGIFKWGNISMLAHNRLSLNTIFRGNLQLCLAGIDPTTCNYPHAADYARWFRYPHIQTSGELLAIEEWINPRDPTKHQGRITVFNHATGEEITGEKISALQSLQDISKISI